MEHIEDAPKTTVYVYTEHGDFTTCHECDKVMLLPCGADKCPCCGVDGRLTWTDEEMQEAGIDDLLKRHYNLLQKNDLEPEEYLSFQVLADEFAPYLIDKVKTAKETLALINKMSELFTVYWTDHHCFRSENLYTPTIKALLEKLNGMLLEGDQIPIEFQDCRSLKDFFNVVANDAPAKQEVTFSSDKDGNYYFNGRKVIVEYQSGYAYRLLKNKICTNKVSPVDFYFDYLARSGPYGTHGNPFYPSITDLICCKYIAQPTKKRDTNE